MVHIFAPSAYIVRLVGAKIWHWAYWFKDQNENFHVFGQLSILLFCFTFSDTGFGTTGGFGSSAFGSTNNTGGLFGAPQNKPGMLSYLSTPVF